MQRTEKRPGEGWNGGGEPCNETYDIVCMKDFWYRPLGPLDGKTWAGFNFTYDSTSAFVYKCPGGFRSVSGVGAL